MSLKPIMNKVTEDEKNWYYEETGERGCICPECKKITFISINDTFTLHQDDDELLPPEHDVKCRHCGKEFTVNSFTVLDPNIAEAISLLNRASIETIFSCEGHDDIGNKSIPYIMFKNDFEELLEFELPDNWIVEKNFIYFSKSNYEERITITYNYITKGYFDYDEYDKEKEMEELKKWALTIFEERKGW